MRKIGIILAALTSMLISANLSACNCVTYRTLERAREVNLQSDCIFIAEIETINSEDGSYRFKVVESLNTTDEEGTEFIGRNLKYCGPEVNTTGKWLLYGHMESGYFEVDDCGMSRSFSEPENIYAGVPIPGPPNPDDEESMKESQEYWANRPDQAKIELEEEILGIRKYFKK